MKHQSIQYHKVSRETFSAVDEIIEDHRSDLSQYLDQLLWWNERINLVSRDVPRETVWEHIRHSLFLSTITEFRSAKTVVDCGTGGGLPGIPLAIAHPEKHFLLNDIVSKKCMVVKQIALKLGLKSIEIIDGSVANLSIDNPFLLVSKHAFKINELWQMTSHLPWKNMVFFKGIDFEEELSGMDLSATITAYKLSENDRESFYQDKAIVIVQR